MGLDQASTVQQAVGSSAGGGSGGMPTLRHAALHSASVRTSAGVLRQPSSFVGGAQALHATLVVARRLATMHAIAGRLRRLLTLRHTSLRRPKGPQGHHCPSGLLPQRAAGRCEPPTQSYRAGNGCARARLLCFAADRGAARSRQMQSLGAGKRPTRLLIARSHRDQSID